VKFKYNGQFSFCFAQNMKVLRCLESKAIRHMWRLANGLDNADVELLIYLGMLIKHCLTWLNLPTVNRFYAQANFHCFPSCLKKMTLTLNEAKIGSKSNHLNLLV